MRIHRVSGNVIAMVRGNTEIIPVSTILRENAARVPVFTKLSSFLTVMMFGVLKYVFFRISGNLTAVLRANTVRIPVCTKI